MFNYGITLNGFYIVDNDLLLNLDLPEELDNEILRDMILERCGDLYPLVQAREPLKQNIHNWFTVNKRNFERILLAINADYSPIENYDRTETHTINKNEVEDNLLNRNESGNETEANSASGSESRSINGTNAAYSNTSTSGDNTAMRAADNSETFRNVTKDTSGASSEGSDSSTSVSNETASNSSSGSMNVFRDNASSETGTRTNDQNILEEIRAHGNIGTSKNSEMVLDEIELRKYNIYEDIISRFEDKFLICVY